MKVVFYNPKPERCGVHQYGKRFFELLKLIPDIEPHYQEVPSENEIRPEWADIAIYNVHQGISNMCKKAPFFLGTATKQIGIYHDDGMDAPFDAWIFSAPSSLIQKENLHLIGRPMPSSWNPEPKVVGHSGRNVLTVGIHGLIGAWAIDMVHRISKMEPECFVRMCLPASDHCDPSGDNAKRMAYVCSEMLGERLEVTHEFMSEPDLLRWLSKNDINCYVRPPLPSLGISSALDLALAVRRPIALNKNSMFRHFNDCSPSVFLEDLSITEINSNGLNPLISMYERHDPINVAKEIQAVLLKVAA